MSTNNLSVADVATKKIRELTESEELKGWIPIDSNVFGTKKFDAEKIALKDAVQAALSNLNNKIETETNARVTLGTRVSSLETKLRGALVFKESLTVSQISNLSLDSIESGFMYTASNAGTIQYTLEGTAKTLTVEAYDEVAWSETGWYIVGRDHEVDLTEYTKTAELASVALSNSYNDLDNKPEIPPAQVNADWNASEGKAVILNKPTLAALALSGDWADILNKPNFHNVATTGDYRDLNNKPTIGTGVITLQVNGTTADSFSANANDNKTINLQIAVPTKTSDLNNDAGFITASDVPQPDWNQTDSDAADFIKNKPSVTQADWDQTDSDAADYIKNKPEIPEPVKPDWDASSSDAAGILNKPTIPAYTSDLNNDLGFITIDDIPVDDSGANSLMTPSQRNKLAGIESGAQVNVQPDWNEIDSDAASYIKNKPTIGPSLQVSSDHNLVPSPTQGFYGVRIVNSDGYIQLQQVEF